MNRIIEHEPADLIAVAEAGVRLSEFNQALSLNGQWLPLDPPDDGRATLGGVVATGLGGAQQIGYGRPRGSVIGMKVVLADGSVIKAGGRVVKNVAGYDLCKLFTGSFGTLGIITELNFKLRPRPQSERTVVATGRSIDLIASGQAILDARLFPVAAELLSSAVANRLGITTDNNSSVLLVRFAGNEKGVEYQTQAALAMFRNNKLVRDTDAIADETELWATLAAVPLQERTLVGWRASVLPSKLSSFVSMVSEIYGDSIDSMLWHVGAGCGRMRMMDSSDRSEEETDRLLDQLRNAVRSVGGALIVESKAADRLSESLRGVASRIKQQLDPQGIFPQPESLVR